MNKVTLNVSPLYSFCKRAPLNIHNFDCLNNASNLEYDAKLVVKKNVNLIASQSFFTQCLQ